MGYEIAGGLGVKMAAPEREVYVLVGDGSYLMMPSEIVTAVQEGLKLTIVLRRQPRLQLDRRPLALARHRGLRHAVPLREGGQPVLDGDGDPAPLCRSTSPRTPASLGAPASTAARIAELRCSARARRRRPTATVVIGVEVDRYEGVPSYESWWDVPVAEVSELPAVQDARREYEEARSTERRLPASTPILGGVERRQRRKRRSRRGVWIATSRSSRSPPGRSRPRSPPAVGGESR